MVITEILRRIWLFSENKTKRAVSEQPAQLIVELNSLSWQKLGTHTMFFRLRAAVGSLIGP